MNIVMMIVVVMCVNCVVHVLYMVTHISMHTQHKCTHVLYMVGVCMWCSKLVVVCNVMHIHVFSECVMCVWCNVYDACMCVHWLIDNVCVGTCTCVIVVDVVLWLIV